MSLTSGTPNLTVLKLTSCGQVQKSPCCRVPLMIRGPGISPGTETEAVALMIDIAPTILDMAGIVRQEQMDGKSLLHLLTVQEIICATSH